MATSCRSSSSSLSAAVAAAAPRSWAYARAARRGARAAAVAATAARRQRSSAAVRRRACERANAARTSDVAHPRALKYGGRARRDLPLRSSERELDARAPRHALERVEVHRQRRQLGLRVLGARPQRLECPAGEHARLHPLVRGARRGRRGQGPARIKLGGGGGSHDRGGGDDGCESPV
ncbi:hypothetical protein T492DRAFT_1012756, partial [Pavlovales sp. CCMP2436]